MLLTNLKCYNKDSLDYWVNILKGTKLDKSKKTINLLKWHRDKRKKKKKYCENEILNSSFIEKWVKDDKFIEKDDKFNKKWVKDDNLKNTHVIENMPNPKKRKIIDIDVNSELLKKKIKLENIEEIFEINKTQENTIYKRMKRHLKDNFVRNTDISCLGFFEGIGVYQEDLISLTEQSWVTDIIVYGFVKFAIKMNKLNGLIIEPTIC